MSSLNQSRRLLQVAGAASFSLLLDKSRPIGTSNEASSFGELSPTSPIYIYRPNPNLEIAFDTRSRNPVYVMERLVTSRRNNSSSVPLKRPNNFYEEKSLPEEFRSRVSHYRHSGYDRGHLAAAANYMHTSQKELNDTFNLINVSPQNHSMNASIWAQLERWTLKVAEANKNGDIYVVSGPLWMPAKQSGDKVFEFQFSAIGTPPSLVSVPTHFYKVVVCVDKGTKQLSKFACFVIPNEADVDKRHGSKRKSLEDFLVPWSSLEAVTGLHFFPALTNSTNWKERANLLTTRISSNSQQGRNLLTDGVSTGSKWRFNESKNGPLAHFCANGRCQ